MRILGVALYLLLVLALSSLAHSLSPDVKVVGDVEAVGFGEIRKLKIFNVFSGLRVTIECKATNSKDYFVTKGSGEVDELGKFHLSVPHDDIVGDDGSLKEACYAQLQSAFGNPCPAHDGLEASKIVFLSKSGEKHVLGLKGKLKFSPEVCISKFVWPMPKIKKPCPPIYKPPVVIPKIAHKPIKKPSVPIHKSPVVIPKKPSPPKIAHKPIHKAPVVIPKKPSPPKIAHKPIYKSPDPIHKAPVVIPKKPSPPLHKAPVPIYKPPVVVIPKKPCPPFPKFPFFPPKDITHPKFGKWPPFPSLP